LIYTDRPKAQVQDFMKEEKGINNIVINLGSMSTVFQTEITTITACEEMIRRSNHNIINPNHHRQSGFTKCTGIC